MSDTVNIHFHYGGTWVFNPNIKYIGGEVDILENFDCDFLSYLDLRDRYIEQYKYAHVSSIFVVEPGKTMNDGLLLIDDDDGIRRVLEYIKKYPWVNYIEVFANHDTDIHLNTTKLLRSEEFELGTQCSVNAAFCGPNVDGGEETVIRENDDRDVADGSNADVGAEEGVTGGMNNDVGREESEYSSESDNESDTETENDSDMEDSNGPQNEKVCYENDGGPYFVLSMTFADAKQARAAIVKYAVARSVKLKLGPNEPGRIRAKCVTVGGCNFLVFLSKDGKNPGLSVKTLQPEHECFKAFENPNASARFLA